MVEKVIDAVAATTPDQLEIVALQTCHAKNTQFRRAGRSPSMATFGRIPRLPGALLTDEQNESRPLTCVDPGILPKNRWVDVGIPIFCVIHGF